MNSDFVSYTKIKRKEVVLLQSGGLDSSICACLFNYLGFTIHHVFVDYGQNSAKMELRTVKEIVEKYGGELHIVKIDLPWLKDSTTLVSGVVKEDNFNCALDTVKAGTYVPLRNQMLISIAGSLAEALKIPYICSALDGSQSLFGRPLGGTTDKHPKFAKSLEKSINEGSAMKHFYNDSITLLTPTMNMNKIAIITMGLELGADLSLSWSCYNGEEEPCGHCGACKLRIECFDALGMKDPVYKKFNSKN